MNIELSHNHYMEGAYQPNCPRCKLNEAAPDLLETLKQINDILTEAQGEWSAVQAVYAPEWTQALKQCTDIAEAAIAKTEKGK